MWFAFSIGFILKLINKESVLHLNSSPRILDIAAFMHSGVGQNTGFKGNVFKILLCLFNTKMDILKNPYDLQASQILKLFSEIDIHINITPEVSSQS